MSASLLAGDAAEGFGHSSSLEENDPIWSIKRLSPNIRQANR
jgi:hypothetical protein